MPAVAGALTGDVAFVPAGVPCTAGSMLCLSDPQATPTNKLPIGTQCCQEQLERSFREREGAVVRFVDDIYSIPNVGVGAVACGYATSPG